MAEITQHKIVYCSMKITDIFVYITITCDIKLEMKLQKIYK